MSDLIKSIVKNIEVRIAEKGGEGSGHHGHVGRPGKVGGSAPKDSFAGVNSSVSPVLNGAKPVDINVFDSRVGSFESDVNKKIMRNGRTNINDIDSYIYRNGLKERVIKELTDHMRGDIDTPIQINSVLYHWSITSNDSQSMSSLQNAASEEFGIPLSSWQRKIKNDVDAGARSWKFDFTLPFSNRDSERKFLRILYESTQDWLKKAGFNPDDKITLFRCIGWDDDFEYFNKDDVGKPIKYNGNVMESWSSLTDMGYGFGKYEIAIDVPVRNIISIPYTGFGCLPEFEWVVLGNTDVQVTAWKIGEEKSIVKDIGVCLINGLSQKGGKGSGHHGHAGRPGKVGGSAPKDSFAGGNSGVSPVLNGARPINMDAVDDLSSAVGTFKSDINAVYTLNRVLSPSAIESINVRSVIKGRVIRKLAEETGIDINIVDSVIHQWAVTSNDCSGALSLQQAASEEFGIPLSDWQKNLASNMDLLDVSNRTSVKDTSIADRKSERKILRAMYGITQEWLRSKGIGSDDKITLFRSFGRSGEELFSRYDIGNSISYSGNVMEAWTSMASAAQPFGWQTFAIDVPAKNILSIAHTGFGCLNEFEWVVLGNHDIMATAWDTLSAKSITTDIVSNLINKLSQKGGPGSGHHGHAGRPGKVGGSAPKDSFAGGGDDGKRYAPISGESILNTARPANYTQVTLWNVGGIDSKVNQILRDGVDVSDVYRSDIRGSIKHRLVTNLSQKTVLDYELVNSMIRQWSYSSNDENAASLSLQKAASEEFGIPLSDWQKGKYDLLKHTIEGDGGNTYRNNAPLAKRDDERRFLRAMYESTQDWLTGKGFSPNDKITLFRGMGSYSFAYGKYIDDFVGSEIPYSGNAMESWSSNLVVASEFGGSVYAINVPIKNILAIPHTGFGCFPEYEWVVLGNHDVYVTAVSLPPHEKPEEKGGPGSGHFGHAGRPGLVGGSAPKDSFAGYGVDDNHGNNHIIKAWNNIPERIKNTIIGRMGGFDPTKDVSRESGTAYRERDAWRAILSAEAESSGDGGILIYETDRNGEYIKIKTGEGEWDYEFSKIEMDKEAVTAIGEILDSRLESRKSLIRDELMLPESAEEFFGVSVEELMQHSIKDNAFDDENIRRVIQKTSAYIDDIDLSQFTRHELEDVFRDYAEEYDRLLGIKRYHNSDGIDIYELPDDDPRKAAHHFANSMYLRASSYAENKNHLDTWSKVSSGEMDIDTARKVSYGEFSSIDDWDFLPNDLYHAATDTDAILGSVIKSRYELGLENNSVGLGGGSSMTVSFTDKKEVAKAIERTFHEAHSVMSGKITASKLIEIAKTGAGANKPYFDDLRPEAKYAANLLLDWEKGSSYRNNDKYWDTLWSFYKSYFLSAREYAGGAIDPLFWGTDWKKLIQIPPEKFKVIRYKPVNANSKGIHLSGLSEWRTVGGGAVMPAEVIDFFDENSDIDEILGLI